MSLNLNSNHCPVCQRNNGKCPHASALSESCGLSRVFNSFENKRLFIEHSIPTNKLFLYDNLIIECVETFIKTGLGNRSYLGDKDTYKTKLATFYNTLHLLAMEFEMNTTDNKPPVFDTKQFVWQPTFVDLFGSQSTAGSAAQHNQPKVEKGSPSKITKPPHRMASSTAHQRVGATFYGIGERNSPIFIEDDDEEQILEESAQQQPDSSQETRQSVPMAPNLQFIPQFDDSTFESELPDAFSTRSNRQPTEEKQLAQIELRGVKYMAVLSKLDLDSVRDFVIALKQEIPVSNNFRITEMSILNPATNDYCMANEKALEIAKDGWFGRDKCLIFKIDGIQKDQLPVISIL